MSLLDTARSVHVVFFFSFLFNTWLPQAPTVLAFGGIFSLCVIPEQSCGLENITRFSIDIVVGSTFTVWPEPSLLSLNYKRQ